MGNGTLERASRFSFVFQAFMNSIFLRFPYGLYYVKPLNLDAYEESNSKNLCRIRRFSPNYLEDVH